ncbi:MAG: DUF6468 domain-containing protein [Pseudomonadota bacterium]
MSFAGLFIDLLVAGLLAVTIGYCALLNRRLKKMRADEDTMRAVITELVKSTETAERAILGLRATASECNKTISARINEARDIVGHLDRSVAVGRHQASHTPRPATAPAPARTQVQAQAPVSAQVPTQTHMAPQAPVQSTAPIATSVQDMQAQIARQVQMGHEELSRRMAMEAQAVASEPFATPMPVNDGALPPLHSAPPVEAPIAPSPAAVAPQKSNGLFDDLEASLAEIARRNRRGAAA